jgi:hypothetical protein
MHHYPMPKKQRIDLEKEMASLDTVCPKCRYSIPPERVRRLDSDRMEYPECGERLVPNLSK